MNRLWWTTKPRFAERGMLVVLWGGIKQSLDITGYQAYQTFFSGSTGARWISSRTVGNKCDSSDPYVGFCWSHSLPFWERHLHIICDMLDIFGSHQAATSAKSHCCFFLIQVEKTIWGFPGINMVTGKIYTNGNTFWYHFGIKSIQLFWIILVLKQPRWSTVIPSVHPVSIPCCACCPACWAYEFLAETLVMCHVLVQVLQRIQKFHRLYVIKSH